MRIRNPLNPARAQVLAEAAFVKIVPTQVVCTDNSTEDIVLATASSVRGCTLEYSFLLPISGKIQTGTLDVIHDGATATIISNLYNYDESVGEFPGLTFSASIVGDGLVLSLTMAAIGEDPLFSYKKIDWPASEL